MGPYLLELSSQLLVVETLVRPRFSFRDFLNLAHALAISWQVQIWARVLEHYFSLFYTLLNSAIGLQPLPKNGSIKNSLSISNIQR